MKCERCGKELSDSDLYCSRCGKAVFPEYMDEEDIWAYYKSDEELEQILKAEEGQKEESQPEVSETEIPLSEKVPLENSQPEILEAEDRESDDVLPEMAVEDPENQEYPEEVSGEEEPASEEAPSPVLEVVKENAEPKDGEAARESEDLDDDEDDDDDEEEEQKEPLTPEKKRTRRYTALLAGIFLLLCLAAGIFLGIRRMNQLDTLEKEYDQKIEESETETSSAETGKIRLLEEEPDLSQNTKLQPASAQADSQKQSEEEDYSGSRLIDGDQTTSWQEGEEGTGEGKGVTISLDGSHPVRYLALYLGNWKSDELWRYNARPQSLAIQVGEAEEEILEFPNEKKVFYLALQEPVEASEIKIRIQSSYEGERWEDNCISEIEVYE
ncbi:MAG TPA: zinc-ribbon domain-containing protein [Candidatus Blautia stercoripullorum]|uniref:Zinc-ribbon domain-containing protein n=1 Tax=Candidatus Blautia stercoripullorum TaxID=2838502 RepID=A0A9D2RAR1_9FIRM|nr:zinc-ribbon domain-containing protein [Candidatus Blautia stercoripullorum]